MKVTLWRVQHCDNSLGTWDSEWFLDPVEADNHHAYLVKEGYDPDSDDGSCGSLLAPESIEVELTPEGILSFARNYAVDEA